MQAPWLLLYLASNQREPAIQLAADRREELMLLRPPDRTRGRGPRQLARRAPRQAAGQS